MTYIRACAGQTVGDTVLAAWDAPIEVGNALPLKNIPLNVKVSCIESRPGSGGVYALAPGTFGKILAKNNLFCKIALASGSIKFLDVNCFATVGRVSNLRWRLFKLRKAGDSRSFGVRPKVRGVAKNPVDHPHGGGKGKKSKNAVPEPPWGRRQKKKKRKGFVKKIS
jgi:large subunit ribosomal protein L2